MKKMVRTTGLKTARKLEGWTFVETLIVIGIVLVLTASVSIMAIRNLGQASIASAKSQIEVYSLAMNSYYLDCRSYPTASQGLEALWKDPGVKGWKGPYINKPVQLDPWGHEYTLVTPGPNGLPFAIISTGADGETGGEGDNADLSSAE